MLDMLRDIGDVFVNNLDVGDLGTGAIIITMLLTLALSVYIFFVYRVASRAVLYSRNFNITMSAMSVVTSMVVLAIGSNPALALGMVGALSIVRFRTAIKDPIDLLFLFWSIATGLVIGAQLFGLALIGALFVAAALLIFNLLPMGGISYLLVVGCDDEMVAAESIALMKGAARKYKLRSRSETANGIELTYELTLSDKAGGLVGRINLLNGVNHAALVAYDGEHVM